MKAFLLFTMLSGLSIVSMGQNSHDSLAVKEVVIAFQQDFNDGSFENAPNYATVDWEHIAPNGGFGAGRDTLIRVLRDIHQFFLKGVTMTIESMSIRFITPDVAIADVIHKVSNYTTPEGIKHENERQIKTYVVVKQKGTWLLTHDHNTIIQGEDTAVNPK